MLCLKMHFGTRGRLPNNFTWGSNLIGQLVAVQNFLSVCFCKIGYLNWFRPTAGKVITEIKG